MRDGSHGFQRLRVSGEVLPVGVLCCRLDVAADSLGYRFLLGLSQDCPEPM